MPDLTESLLMAGLLPTTAFPAAENAAETAGACVDSGIVCETVYNLTGWAGVAQAADHVVHLVLRMALIVLVALFTRWFLHRGVDRLADALAAGEPPKAFLPLARRAAPTAMLTHERRTQRAETVRSLLTSMATVTVFGVAFIMILSELGLDVAAVVASAGIVGVALGFGAQSVVADFLTGLFMLLEDAFGVGDIIDLGEASGIVESVGLRTTSVRDTNGVLWHVRNGVVVRVGNKSQGWSRAVVDIAVAYSADLNQAKEVVVQVAEETYADPKWHEVMLDPPDMWGVDRMTAEGVVLRLVVKTVPLQQFALERELRWRVKTRFDAEGIEMPFTRGPMFMPAVGSQADRNSRSA